MIDPAVAVRLRDLSDRYADAVDRRDPGGLLAIFTPDATLRVQPDDGPVDSEWSGTEISATVDAVARYARTFHHVGGAVYDAEGEDRATGRVVCLAHHYDRTGSGPVDLVMMIRYHDVYVQTAEVWLISERRVAIEWTELHPAHPPRRRK